MTERGSFRSKLGFIAAAAGTAVGIGNIWRFPFEVANGGGALFILVYLGFCFLICFPLMVAELAIGRKAATEPSSAFAVLGFENWSFLGKMGIAASVFGLSLYSVVAAWAFGYVFEMAIANFTIGTQFSEYAKDIVKVGLYGLAFMGLTAVIVSKGISGGIEKASKILMPLLLAMIIILGAYALTLPHAFSGISFYLVPDFTKLNLTVITGAVAQAFFSLSLGMGAYITYGSYLPKKDNVTSSAALITLADVGVAFLAGFMMFPFIAYIGSGSMEGVIGGPGLIFETLPGIFGTLGPATGAVVGSVFFLLLTFAALTSAVALLEVPVATLIDGFKIKRTKATWIMAAFIFMLSIPSLLGNGYSQLFTEFIQYGGSDSPINFLGFLLNVNDAIMLSGGFGTSVFVAYIWKKRQLTDELLIGFPKYPSTLIKSFIDIAIGYLCPLILGTILILTILNRYFGISPW